MIITELDCFAISLHAAKCTYIPDLKSDYASFNRVIIPPHATDLLDFHLHKSGLHLDHTKCRNLLGHKVMLPTVSWLKERGIPYNMVIIDFFVNFVA